MKSADRLIWLSYWINIELEMSPKGNRGVAGHSGVTGTQRQHYFWHSHLYSQGPQSPLETAKLSQWLHLIGFHESCLNKCESIIFHCLLFYIISMMDYDCDSVPYLPLENKIELSQQNTYKSWQWVFQLTSDLISNLIIIFEFDWNKSIKLW